FLLISFFLSVQAEPPYPLMATLHKAYLLTSSDAAPMAIPHKERLATLHAICLQISRHISQKCS
ncbi:MAG: hypothetical protein MSH13_09695, partial [Ruminococcus callidus]|nr:hypothetical protein [Ruminococcus callidus]